MLLSRGVRTVRPTADGAPPATWVAVLLPCVCLRKVGDAQHEADGVENVGLAAAVEASDGVELGVEARDLRARSVRLEAVQHNPFDVHGAAVLTMRLKGVLGWHTAEAVPRARGRGGESR